MLVIGVGNELRGDDGAGLAVARRLRVDASAPVDVAEQGGESIDLLQAWEGRDAVVLVDTMRSGAPTGTIRRFEASDEPLPRDIGSSSSTHLLGVGEAIELARALGQLPRRTIIYAIEGAEFTAGTTLSEELRARLADLAAAVLREANQLARGG